MKEDKIRRREELRNKNKQYRKSKDFIPMLLTSIMIFFILLLSYSYYLTTAVDNKNSDKITIEIKESYGSSAVADVLYNNDLIKSRLMFKIYSKITSNSQFYVGKFDISKNMNISEILSELTDQTKAKSSKPLVIIEGENILKISSKIEQFTEIKSEDFINKVNDEEFINKLKEEFPELITDRLKDKNIKYKLEGYLFPATYSIDNTNRSNVEALIREMVKTTNARVLPLFEKNNKQWNISGVEKTIDIHDYITMASILEKESTATTDNNGIAGVFLNRLAVIMPLQTDPSVYYSLGKTSGDLTFADLQNTDPYNTYTNYGLPPGPISSPSAISYDALNNATKHEYLFFLTDKDGKAYFAKTFAEHEELAQKYVSGYIKSN